jgi:hypothetical protein
MLASLDDRCSDHEFFRVIPMGADAKRVCEGQMDVPAGLSPSSVLSNLRVGGSRLFVGGGGGRRKQ